MSNEALTEITDLRDALLETSSVEEFLHELAVLAARAVSTGEGLSCGLALRQAAPCEDG